MQRGAFIITLSLVFLLFLSFRFTCSSSVGSQYVDPLRPIVVPDDFAKIQDAINNATPGDTVYVRAGVYDEQLLVNKSISLIGENKTTTIVESGILEDTLTVTTDNATVSGFTIRNTEDSPTTSLSYGVKLFNTHNTTISDNIIMKNNQGVGVVGGSGNVIQYNMVTKNRYGIFVSGFRINNTISHNYVMSINNTISHNYVSDSDWNGIEIDWGGGNVICANTIIGSMCYGLEIPYYTPSYNNIIFHNNFVDNVRAEWIEGVHRVSFQAYGMTPNSWDNNSEGNYWSDYAGKDENSDGIGDTGYFAGAYGTEDHYPLMGNFSDVTVSGSTIDMVSDSLITGSDFSLNGTAATLSISIVQEANSTGFCRVSVPKALMTDPYEVRLDGEVITYSQARELPSSDGTHECLYVDYPQGKHSLEINATAVLLEFPVPTFLVPFAIAELMTLVICRRRHRHAGTVF